MLYYLNGLENDLIISVLGEKKPSRVRADVTVNLNVRSEIKGEWENLRKHDVCFLVTVKPVLPIGEWPTLYYTSYMSRLVYNNKSD